MNHWLCAQPLKQSNSLQDAGIENIQLKLKLSNRNEAILKEIEQYSESTKEKVTRLLNAETEDQAEIYLLPEEYSIFCSTLSEHDISFPTQYQQLRQVNPHIIHFHMESIELPVQFAERLSAALNILK